jgi:hypothetical protein
MHPPFAGITLFRFNGYVLSLLLQKHPGNFEAFGFIYATKVCGKILKVAVTFFYALRYTANR